MNNKSSINNITPEIIAAAIEEALNGLQMMHVEYRSTAGGLVFCPMYYNKQDGHHVDEQGRVPLESRLKALRMMIAETFERATQDPHNGSRLKVIQAVRNDARALGFQIYLTNAKNAVEMVMPYNRGLAEHATAL